MHLQYFVLHCKSDEMLPGDSYIDGLQQNKLILYATNTIYMSRWIRLAC